MIVVTCTFYRQKGEQSMTTYMYMSSILEIRWYIERQLACKITLKHTMHRFPGFRLCTVHITRNISIYDTCI